MPNFYDTGECDLCSERATHMSNTGTEYSEHRCEQHVHSAPEHPFEITSDRAANWLLRRLANIEAEKARVTAQAAAIVKALESDAERLQFLYGGQLESYCREKIASGRVKTVRFLQGTCAFRTVPTALRIADESEAIKYADKWQHEEVFEVKRHFLRAGYLKLAQEVLQETGEVLPGLEMTPERESFSVKFRGE